jgi:hypothetical protein
LTDDEIFMSTLVGPLLIRDGCPGSAGVPLARSCTLPLFLGWALLGSGLFGAILMPVAGFCFVLLQAVIVQVVARRGAQTCAHPRADDTRRRTVAGE